MQPSAYAPCAVTCLLTVGGLQEAQALLSLQVQQTGQPRAAEGLEAAGLPQSLPYLGLKTQCFRRVTRAEFHISMALLLPLSPIASISLAIRIDIQ